MKYYECIRSYTDKEIGEIYSEEDKPIWFKNYNNVRHFIKESPHSKSFFKETDKIKKEVIPEYVEYIDTKYKGQIVKVEEWTNHNFCCIRFENGQREQPFKNLVKPSTKEAFDKQNQNSIFKEGDWVYRIKEGSPGNKVTQGKVYKVLSYTSKGDLMKIIDDSGFPGSFDGKNFRKALPNEIPQQCSLKELGMSTVDLKNTKIWIGDNPELSRKVQEKALELGFKWLEGGKKVTNCEKYALYFHQRLNITYSGTTEKYYFSKHSYKEIFPSDLGIDLPTCPYSVLHYKFKSPKTSIINSTKPVEIQIKNRNKNNKNEQIKSRTKIKIEQIKQSIKIKHYVN